MVIVLQAYENGSKVLKDLKISNKRMVDFITYSRDF